MHFAAAGCRPEALRYALEAADKAANALAFDSAARFCRMGLELQPTEPDLVLALQRKLGEALSGPGRGAKQQKRISPRLTSPALRKRWSFAAKPPRSI